MRRAKRQNQRPDKNKQQQFKRHTTKHHVYPTSRFVLKKNPVLHTAWHDVFQNKTPEEAIETVNEWITNPEEFEKEIAGEPRKISAWKKLFGESNIPSKEAMEIIERDWTFRGVRMVKIKRT